MSSKQTDWASIREQHIHRKMTTCRHFNGVQNKQCKAGIEYPTRSETTCLPCMPDFVTARKRTAPECILFSPLTREEAEIEYQQFEAELDRMRKARKAAKEHAKELGLGRGHGGFGNLPCPCCDGTLRYSVASINGHMHASCTTKGCVRWME